MYIVYSNKIYRFLISAMELLTYKLEKIDNSFENDDGIYYKKIEYSDINIQDIYDVDFYIEWDSKMPKVQKKWKVTSLYDDKVKLFHEGHLPGWTIEEKLICSLVLDMEEIERYSIKYMYIIKDGKKLEEPFVIENEVNKEVFKEIFEQYINKNI